MQLGMNCCGGDSMKEETKIKEFLEVALSEKDLVAKQGIMITVLEKIDDLLEDSFYVENSFNRSKKYVWSDTGILMDKLISRVTKSPRSERGGLEKILLEKILLSVITKWEEYRRG